MPTANYDIGDHFPVQFVWRLPNENYLRAVFDAEVLEHVDRADKYLLRLHKLVAGRQEDAEGELIPLEEYSKEYWALVGKLQGHRVSIAYEVDDGRALHLRLATLTGEHDFFTRWQRIPTAWIQQQREKQAKRDSGEEEKD